MPIEIHKNMITGETDIKEILVQVERDSISMGDDITAPHHNEFFFKKEDKLSDLFKKLLSYLIKIENLNWEIICENKILGNIIVDSEKNVSFTLNIKDESITNYNNKMVYCKKFQI